MADLFDNKAFRLMIESAEKDNTAANLFSADPAPEKDLLEKIHDGLMVAGMAPFVGNVADAADALLFAYEGEFGDAAISAAAMIPFLGQAVSAKKALKIAKDSGEEMYTLYRGVDEWHPGKMVKDGRFVGGGHHVDPKVKESLWVTENKKYAEDIAYAEDSYLLEFEVPKSFLDKHFTQTTRIDQQKTGLFHKGLDKAFLKKVYRMGDESTELTRDINSRKSLKKLANYFKDI